MNAKELEKHYAKGIAAHQAGRIAEAEAIYGRILKLVPQADTVLTNMAALQYGKENYDLALRYVERALKVNPLNGDAIVNRATILLALGNHGEALKGFEQVIRMNGANHIAHYNIGNLNYNNGALDKAEEAFRRAVALKPDFPQAQFNLGNLLAETNRQAEACSAYEKALAAMPHHTSSHHNLATLISDGGDWEGAVRQVKLGLEVDPDSALLWQLLSRLHSDVGQWEPALESIEKALIIDPSRADAWVLKGNILRDLKRISEAILAFERALLIAPGYEGAKHNLQKARATDVPKWHFSMLADRERNSAFDRVIRRHVKEGDQVLDIGTGSGLLSMMAVRAGAAQVVACEREIQIAEVAREIVKKNGFADKIEVLALDSRLLRMGKEIQEKFDVIVTEILDVSLIGEGMLPSIRAALRTLAKPGAKVIPAGARVRIQLVDIPKRYEDPELENIEGFDLTEFERFRSKDGREFVNLKEDYKNGRSEILILREFDFLNPGYAYSEEKPDRFTVEFKEVQAGAINGLLLWFDLDLDEETTLGTGPGGVLCHWGQAFYPLQVKADEAGKVTIRCEMFDFGWKFN